MRLAAQAKGGYYPTPDRVVEMIGGLIRIPPGSNRRHVLRLLDPCCGAGDAAANLADALRARGVPVETYGVEAHRERAVGAAARLDRVLAADLFATVLANGAFGLLFLNPPYDVDAERRRAEHAFLTHGTRRLAPDGLLVLIVPRLRLGVSARHLASHYRDLRCWAFPRPERDAFDQVVLMGIRRPDPVPDPNAERRIDAWAAGGLTDLPDGRRPAFDAPLLPRAEIAFAARGVDPVAAASEARRAGLWVDDRIADALRPDDEACARPLMPLRRGHLAMLVAAGFLDNLALEAHGRRVLVKGRTAKEMRLAEETETAEIHRERLVTTVVALDLDDGTLSDIAA